MGFLAEFGHSVSELIWSLKVFLIKLVRRYSWSFKREKKRKLRVYLFSRALAMRVKAFLMFSAELAKDKRK